MLNTLVFTRFTAIILILLSGWFITPGLYITSPESGALIEGIVEIRGSIPEEDFSSAEVLYSYSQEGVENWFLIERIDSVVQDDVLATWDTTTITDGVYQLKLMVITLDGNENEVVVSDIHVSNYTRGDEQPTSAAMGSSGINPGAAVGLMVTPGPTGLPVNPASIIRDEVRLTVISGILIASVLLGLLIMYTSIQSYRRRR